MADSLEEQIRKYLLSKEGQAKVIAAQKTNKDFGKGNGSGGTEAMAKEYAVKMKEFLRNEVCTNELRSTTTLEFFLDYINTKIYFKNGIGWVVDVSFDENEVYRYSLDWGKYNYPIYLPTLVNNAWSGSPNPYLHGYDRHGQYVGASDKYMNGSFKGFIFRAVENFKKQVNSNIEIIISNEFTE